MIYVRDHNDSYVSGIDKAYDVNYSRAIDEIWECVFTVPLDDPVREKIEHFGWVDVYDMAEEYIGLFRVLPYLITNKYPDLNAEYTCYHAIQTLGDNSYFGSFIGEQITVSAAITEILSAQKEELWVLGRCEATELVDLVLHYENDLIAQLYGVLDQLGGDYMFEFETASKPWVINVVKIPEDPVCRIKEGYNMLGFTIESDPSAMINRVYPYMEISVTDEDGESESEFITIETATDTGVKYVQDDDMVEKYGPIELVKEMADDANPDLDITLLHKFGLDTLLEQLTPSVVWRCEATDLSKLAEEPLSIDVLRIGRTVKVETHRFGEVNLVINKESKSDIMHLPNQMTIEMHNGKMPYHFNATNIRKKLEDGEKRTKVLQQSIMARSRKAASDLLNAGYGGFVRYYPDRILILDIDDEETAQNVWMYNKNGVGFSSSGINGPYVYAWTKDGNFNSSFITANSISVNQLKSDVGQHLDISSNQHILSRVTKNQILTDVEIQGSLKGTGVSSIVAEYAYSDSATNPPSTGWKEDLNG